MSLPENFRVYEESLLLSSPPDFWPEALQAMWWDAKGNWEKSHDIGQEIHSDIGYWIHAYLHRQEGDEWNAGYWYRRANRKFPGNSLQEEHREIVNYILKQMNG